MFDWFTKLFLVRASNNSDDVVAQENAVKLQYSSCSNKRLNKELQGK